MAEIDRPEVFRSPGLACALTGEGDLRGWTSSSRPGYGLSTFGCLKAILGRVRFGACEAGVISASLLIKNSPQTCGQTLKSNRFLHRIKLEAQKYTTRLHYQVICGVFSQFCSPTLEPTTKRCTETALSLHRRSEQTLLPNQDALSALRLQDRRTYRSSLH